MIVALDFDGVIMDGINECMLVAWNVFNKEPLSAFNKQSFKKIPLKFVDTFFHMRNFVRHDGHFIASFFFDKNQAVDNDMFNVSFEKIAEKDKLLFRENFVHYRDNVKKIFPEYWLSLHKELIPLNDIINLDVDVRIVSGKDSESISFLLNNKGIKIDRKKIYGRMTEKNKVLNDIKNDADKRKEALIFVDDNLSNVIDARGLGIESLWAFWGFHTPVHLDDAERLSIKAIDKEGLFKIIQSLKWNEGSENDWGK